MDDTATGVNDGTSWADAYTDLQDAINQILPAGQQVWVAAGIYKPTSGSDLDNSGATTSREWYFQLRQGLAVYGGFDGTETERTQRDLAAPLGRDTAEWRADGPTLAAARWFM